MNQTYHLANKLAVAICFLYISLPSVQAAETKTVTVSNAEQVFASGAMQFPANIRSVGKGWYRADLEVPEFFLTSLKANQSVTLILPFTQNKQVVSNLKLDAKTSKPYLKFQFPHSALTGMSLQAQLTVSKTALYKVPIGAIFSPTANQQWVFVVENGKAKKLSVQPWKVSDGELLVAGPLSQDALVINSKLNQVYDNQTVEVK